MPLGHTSSPSLMTLDATTTTPRNNNPAKLTVISMGLTLMCLCGDSLRCSVDGNSLDSPLHHQGICTAGRTVQVGRARKREWRECNANYFPVSEFRSSRGGNCRTTKRFRGRDNHLMSCKVQTNFIKRLFAPATYPVPPMALLPASFLD